MFSLLIYFYIQDDSYLFIAIVKLVSHATVDHMHHLSFICYGTQSLMKRITTIISHIVPSKKASFLWMLFDQYSERFYFSIISTMTAWLARKKSSTFMEIWMPTLPPET